MLLSSYLANFSVLQFFIKAKLIKINKIETTSDYFRYFKSGSGSEHMIPIINYDKQEYFHQNVFKRITFAIIILSHIYNLTH